VIAACVKWVGRRPEAGSVDGRVVVDSRTGGISDADAAALEWALRCGTARHEPVVVLTAGRPEAEAALRDALACGASRAIRVDLGAELPSRTVAASLAAPLRELGASTIWCGDHSLDRGSGSVPAFLAAELGLPQALGLVQVELGEREVLTVLRRLDGRRRERLRTRGAAVLSVEGSTARLRRASLASALGRASALIEVRACSASDALVGAPSAPPVLRPYRPRARVLPGPAGERAHDRVVALTAAATTQSHRDLVTLEPAAAAERILAALRDWGYLSSPSGR
jgi:electron transfer flavoprotein beta subunit